MFEASPVDDQPQTHVPASHTPKKPQLQFERKKEVKNTTTTTTPKPAAVLQRKTPAYLTQKPQPSLESTQNVADPYDFDDVTFDLIDDSSLSDVDADVTAAQDGDSNKKQKNAFPTQSVQLSGAVTSGCRHGDFRPASELVNRNPPPRKFPYTAAMTSHAEPSVSAKTTNKSFNSTAAKPAGCLPTSGFAQLRQLQPTQNLTTNIRSETLSCPQPKKFGGDDVNNRMQDDVRNRMEDVVEASQEIPDYAVVSRSAYIGDPVADEKQDFTEESSTSKVVVAQNSTTSSFFSNSKTK